MASATGFVRVSTIALALCLIGCVGTSPKPGSSGQELPDADELKHVAEITAIGREIYRQDWLAWRATDVLRADIGNIRPHGKSGWIVTNVDNGALVTFFESEDDKPKVFADVEIPYEGKPTVRVRPDRSLSENEVVRVRARGIGLKAGVNSCSQTFNSAVLPASNGGWDVYVLAASTEATTIPVGGHSRVSVSSDGRSILGIERYSKTCTAIVNSDDKAVALFTTHVVDDLPAPTHVFLSLSFRKPMYVRTRTHAWRVDVDGSIKVASNEAN